MEGKNKDLLCAKQLAKCFLNIEPSQDEVCADFGLVIHPFWETVALCDNQGIFNLLEDKERYERYCEWFSDNVIDKCSSLSEVVERVRKSYRVTFIYYLHKKEGLSKKVCGNLLAEQWTNAENLNRNINVPQRSIKALIKAADKEAFMNKKDLEVYNNLPEEVVIYRGTDNLEAIKNFSWTISLEKGQWFADRAAHFWGKGYLFSAKIKKSDIIAYTNQRSEKEVIVDVSKLYDIEQIS